MQSEDPRLARAQQIAAGATRTARDALPVDE